MDTDRIEGIGHQVKGAVKRAFGQIIGDANRAITAVVVSLAALA